MLCTKTNRGALISQPWDLFDCDFIPPIIKLYNAVDQRRQLAVSSPRHIRVATSTTRCFVQLIRLFISPKTRRLRQGRPHLLVLLHLELGSFFLSWPFRSPSTAESSWRTSKWKTGYVLVWPRMAGVDDSDNSLHGREVQNGKEYREANVGFLQCSSTAASLRAYDHHRRECRNYRRRHHKASTRSASRNPTPAWARRPMRPAASNEDYRHQVQIRIRLLRPTDFLRDVCRLTDRDC